MLWGANFFCEVTSFQKVPKIVVKECATSLEMVWKDENWNTPLIILFQQETRARDLSNYISLGITVHQK